MSGEVQNLVFCLPYTVNLHCGVLTPPEYSHHPAVLTPPHSVFARPAHRIHAPPRRVLTLPRHC